MTIKKATFGGGSPWPYPQLDIAPSIASATAITTGASSIAFVGAFWHKDGIGTSKNITGIEINWGAITAGGTPATARVSLQGVGTTGNPMKPNGTIAGAGGANWTKATNLISANTWDAGSTFTGVATTVGAAIAIVIDYSAFTAGDSITVRGASRGTGTSIVNTHNSMAVRSTDGSTYALSSIVPNVALLCDDSTYGGIMYGMPFTSVNTRTFNSGTAGTDEYAIGMKYTAPVSISQAFLNLAMTANASDFDFGVYSAPTTSRALVGTAGAIKGAWSSTNSGTGRPAILQAGSEWSLSANTLYTLSVKPTSANNVALISLTCNHVNILRDLWMGADFCEYGALDGGNFSVVNSGLNVPMIFPAPRGFDDASAISNRANIIQAVGVL